MKKFLPIFFLFVFAVQALSVPLYAHAQAAPIQATASGQTSAGKWVIDPEVTFIGKNAARAGLFLNWTLLNYNWVCVNKVNTRQCDDTNNPIEKYWSLIVLYIVVPLLFVVILATSVVIIITRGKSLTIMKFIPRFIAVILLIVFSYSLLQFFYQFTDLIQGFFLRSDINKPCPPDCIQQEDLLYVGWDYRTFVGLRLLGDQYAESAFISLLLTKLTALTYFVMTFLLLVRKIILWFFIIVSPIFPILLLYYPVRNTGKIWIGEFFRWLLYAPLFAIFLNGLVYLWKNQIPLVFVNPNINVPGTDIFPTAVNILLGGPRQFVTPNNSVNLIETFALYVVSLIMLWIVILLPWILLQIFLDYAQNFAPGDTAVMKTLVNLATNNKPPAGGGGSQPPSTGAAIALPFGKKFSIPKDLQNNPTGSAKSIPVELNNVRANFAQPAYIPNATVNNASVNAQVATIANVKIPSMRDIARYDSALTSRDTSRQQDVSRITQTLERIANPVAVTNTVEREQYINIQDKVSEHSEKGNIVASSILKAATSVSKDRIQASTNELKSVLAQIANPASTSTNSSTASVINRDKLNKLHDTLQKQSTQSSQSSQSSTALSKGLMSISDKSSASEVEKVRDQLKVAASKGDKVASSIISTVNSATQKSQAAVQTKNVLQKIANPASVTNTAEREKFTKLHDALKKENSTLASSILQVSDSTSVSQLDKIREQLSQSKESTVLQSVNNAVSQSQSTTHVKSVLQEVANPATAKVIDKEKISKLHESLSKASKEGNSLASSILSVSDKTSVADIEKLQEKIQEARSKGEPIATQLSAITQASQSAGLPSINRVQQVSKEDFQAVRDMWKQNYQNLEVPQGMAGTRSEWIKDDIAGIDETIGLLTSTDEEKVKEGMDQVSNILPFLMVGGFSTQEIVAYLQAKQDAAKDVSKTLAADEDDKVSVNTQVAHTARTMSATMEEEKSSTSSTSSSSSSSDDSEDESPLSALHTTNVSNVSTTTVSPQVSNEILAMVNLKLPKLRDIAQYETRGLKKDTSRKEEVEKTQAVLGKIADPSKISNTTERAQFEKVRQTLLDEGQKGNLTAAVLLKASAKTQGKPVETAKDILARIANPSLATADVDKKRFTELHDNLDKASKEGNELATAILATKDATSIDDIKKLSEKLKAAKEEPVAQSVLMNLPDTNAMPEENRLQPVSDEDYEEVRKMWEENYRTLPVPAEFGTEATGRVTWIESDGKVIEETIALLTSTDTEKLEQGMQKVVEILPMLTLGGFTNSEIVGYLKAKVEAGRNVVAELQKEEEGKVTLDASAQKDANTQELSAKTSEGETDEKKNS